MLRCVGWILIVVAAAGITGCGTPEVKLRHDLKMTGLMYHNYHDDNQQGPPGWDEFIAYADAQQAGDALRRVREAGYELKWGVRFRDVTEGTSNVVLASSPKGGPVLMLDGAVPE